MRAQAGPGGTSMARLSWYPPAIRLPPRKTAGTHSGPYFETAARYSSFTLFQLTTVKNSFT